jgi:hypothetical protein
MPMSAGLLQRKCACGGTPGFYGECAGCRRKRLGLQRRATLRTEPLEATARDFVGPPPGHDFSRVHIYAPKIRQKLIVNTPGDVYEQEADEVADRVMRMPHAGPHRTRHTRQVDGLPDGTEAPPIAHEVLRSPGQPLNAATRAFFTPRFGWDFSNVRVHTDATAAVAANAVNAKAFTVGNTIVFGAGQYSPTSSEGRRFLAHELTHVVQQARPSNRLRLARAPLSSVDASNVLQRSPDKPTETERRHDQRIEELAKWPSSAHDAWKRLNAVDRNLVVLQMASNYGVPFARAFLNAVTTWRPQNNIQHYFGPGVGPKHEKLLAGGYKLAQKDSVHEWWIHPSGKSVTRNYTQDKPSPTASEEKKKQPEPPQAPQSRPPPPQQPTQQPRTARCQDVAFLAQHICENSERICEIAKQVDDPEAQATCERSRATCKEANERSTACITEEE